MNTSEGGKPLQQLEHVLDEYLIHKAPFQLPGGLKQFIVKVAPWLNLLFIITLLPVVLFALGLGAILSPFLLFGDAAYHAGAGLFTLIFAAGSIVLQAIAVPGLFKRNAQGWNFLYYATLLMAVADIVYFSITGLIGVLISLYILFQVKSLYAGKTVMAAPSPKSHPPKHQD
ncbi:chromate transporter [Candidatus Peregrinibacteria bacterium CG11_big_fil_rev_8_21_14_0_20_46_8]|nr:MAG: chromate transporter [Candidatus Peregrinibacteria bacterium CG11_big_fil_rev_8_21_14_0_20_46_8]